MVHAMLSGSAKQQLGGRLSRERTAKVRTSIIRSFIDFCDTYPWLRTVRIMNEWSAHLVGELGGTKSIIHQKPGAVRLFSDYATSPYYDWPAQREALLGQHPIHIYREWNTAEYLVDSLICHITENGVDPKFLQEIAGHRYACAAGIYTHVSEPFMDTMLDNALGRVSFGEKNR